MKQIQMRNNTEIWVTDEQAKKILIAIQDNRNDFILIEGNAINPKDIVGIFTEDVAYEREQKRRGLWQADNGRWLTKQEDLFREPFIPVEKPNHKLLK
jgi:hypothetical protein